MITCKLPCKYHGKCQEAVEKFNWTWISCRKICKRQPEDFMEGGKYYAERVNKK